MVVSFHEFTTVILCVNLPPLFCRETFPHVDAVIRKGYAAEKKQGLKRTAATPLKPLHVRRAHWHHYWTGARGICRTLSGAQMDTACLCRRCLRRYRHHSPGQRRPAVILINIFA